MTIWKPNEGFQERFVTSNVDFVVGGGAMASGKTVGALLMAAEHVIDPNFRMVFIRRNIGDIKVGGGGIDEAIKIYGHMATAKISDSPRLLFNSGAFIDFTHMADQTPEKVLERIKGWQYSCIYVDEATGFEWSTIRLLLSRNRSQAEWSGKFRCTCNPKRNHWLRYWVDWYVDEYGDPIPERDGIVRYFYVNGDNIEDVVFGDSKMEVYLKCKNKIDGILEKMNKKDDVYTYEDIIKSTTFYAGNVAENTKLLDKDPGYIGSVASMGERQMKANLMGNWNVDEDEDEAPIKRAKVLALATNELQQNNELYLTVDLADTGTDNCIILIWNGLTIIDFLVIQKSTPAENCAQIDYMAKKHNIGEGHIVYDAQRAAYMINAFPYAMPYISYKPAKGIYKRVCERIKDECYFRMADCINNNRMSVLPEVANAIYPHQKRKNITLLEEIVKECAVVQFNTSPSGKKKLDTKKNMNRHLGTNVSMDVADAIAMRFFPILDRESGYELDSEPHFVQYDDNPFSVNIYDESIFI